MYVFVQTQYTLARAQQSFKSLVHIHEKGGNVLMSVCLCGCLVFPYLTM